MRFVRHRAAPGAVLGDRKRPFAASFEFRPASRSGAACVERLPFTVAEIGDALVTEDDGILGSRQEVAPCFVSAWH